MSRFSILVHGLLAGTLLCIASPGHARGDQGDDDRLARKLVTAASKSFEYKDATDRYGVMAEIAQTMLQKREQKADLGSQIGILNAKIATFPQNRLRWLVEDWEVYNYKLACDQQVAMLNREIEELDFRQQRIYEEELAKARASKRSVRPIRRDTILEQLNRLDRECDAAFADLKEGIDAAAREEGTNRRKVWARICGAVEDVYPRPDVPDAFLREFVKNADGDPWLDGVDQPSMRKTKPGQKPSTGKTRKKTSPPRKVRS